MIGYVGERAKKRKRNIISFIFFILLIILIFYFFPNIDFIENNPKPEDSILPNSNEKISSLSTTIEDLRLLIFQKIKKLSFAIDKSFL